MDPHPRQILALTPRWPRLTALLHRSFLRQVKTDATAEGFTVRAERKEGWSQAKGVTAMEYRIKLGPENRVSAIQPIPGKQSTEP